MNNLQDAFPHYTLQETLRFRMSAGNPLPEGYYEVIDYYGPNFENDDPTVTLRFLKLDWEEGSSVPIEHSLGAFKYDLDSPISDDNPKLTAKTTRLMPTLIIWKFLSEFLKSHPDYHQELRRRYEIEKAEALERAHIRIKEWPSSAPDMPITREHCTGRNDPCHCGSGKKFKKCCMTK